MQALIVGIEGDTLEIQRTHGTWKYPIKPWEPGYANLGLLRERKAKGWDWLAIATFEPSKPDGKGFLRLVGLAL